MRTKRLIGGLCVVGAALAACFGGEPDLGFASQPVLQSDMPFYNFGTVNVGSSGSLGIMITSQTAGEDDTLTSISEMCGDFSLDLNPPPGGYRIWCDTSTGSGQIGSGSGVMCIPNAYMFTAKFMPIGAGSSSCTVRVDYTHTGMTQGQFFNITLQGNGSASSQSLAISPPNGSILAFGDIPMGQSSQPQTVVIYNNGTTPLSVNGSTSGSYTYNPVLGQVSLPPNGSASYDVRCAPTGLGSQPGTLKFNSAAPQVGVTMTCNGVPQSSLRVTPVPGNFAPTTVGKPPADITLTADNTGGLPTTINVSLQNASPELTIVQNPNGMQLGSGSSAAIVLRYSAATDHPMGQLGTVSVTGTGIPTSSNIAINGTALTAALGVSPGTAIDFGPVCVGAHADQTVTLYASAAGPVNVSSVSLPSAPFTANSVSGPLIGAHGNSINLTASVAPTGAGDLSDKLTIHTDLAMANQDVMLTAKALPAGVTPTPDVVHFGPNRVQMLTTAKEIKVSNCSPAPLNITSAHIEGPNAAEFNLVTALPASPIAEKDAATFLVVMDAASNGQKQAQLVINYDGGAVAVNLDGNGFGGDVSSGDRTTYYACDAGGPAGLGAALLPLALVLRRRRRRA